MSDRLNKTIIRVRKRIEVLEGKDAINSQAAIKELKPILDSLMKVKEEVFRMERERRLIGRKLQDAATYMIRLRDAIQ